MGTALHRGHITQLPSAAKLCEGDSWMIAGMGAVCPALGKASLNAWPGILAVLLAGSMIE